MQANKNLKSPVYFDGSKLVSKQARANTLSKFGHSKKKERKLTHFKKNSQTRASKHVIAFMLGIDETQKTIAILGIF